MALKKSNGKGIATLLVSVHAELDRDSQTLWGCLRELAERYVTPSSVSVFCRGGIPWVSIADMDAERIGLQMISPVPVMLCYWGPAQATDAFARMQNDFIVKFM